MARPITPAQAQQNRDFLTVLRRTGNVRLSAREAGAKYGTMQHRRRVHPGFAVRWDAALAFAQARLSKSRHGNESHDVGRAGDATRRPAGAVSRQKDARCAPLTLCSAAHRTIGGEPRIVRCRSGRLQVRRAQPGKLTRAAEQAFLAALSATCNVSLAAAAVGASPHAFYRRRMRCPAFAREMRLALKAGYDRLEEALLESAAVASHDHDDWRTNAPPAMPPVSANQALQLMYLHQKEARLIAEPFPIRRMRGESREAYCTRLAIIAEERRRLALEEFEIAEVERHALGQRPWGPAGEDVRRRLGLPDLAQVTRWSRADAAKRRHDPDRALFGGWRIKDLERAAEAEWDEDF